MLAQAGWVQTGGCKWLAAQRVLRAAPSAEHRVTRNDQVREHSVLGGPSPAPVLLHSPMQVGWMPLHVPSAWQVLFEDPTSRNGDLHWKKTSDL